MFSPGAPVSVPALSRQSRSRDRLLCCCFRSGPRPALRAKGARVVCTRFSVGAFAFELRFRERFSQLVAAAFSFGVLPEFRAAPTLGIAGWDFSLSVNVYR